MASSHGTRNWNDIAAAARELLDAIAGRLDTLAEGTEVLSEHKEGFRDGLTAVVAHPAAVRLRTLLETVDASRTEPADDPPADERWFVLPTGGLLYGYGTGGITVAGLAAWKDCPERTAAIHALSRWCQERALVDGQPTQRMVANRLAGELREMAAQGRARGIADVRLVQNAADELERLVVLLEDARSVDGQPAPTPDPPLSSEEVAQGLTRAMAARDLAEITQGPAVAYDPESDRWCCTVCEQWSDEGVGAGTIAHLNHAAAPTPDRRRLDQISALGGHRAAIAEMADDHGYETDAVVGAVEILAAIKVIEPQHRMSAVAIACRVFCDTEGTLEVKRG